MPVNNSPIGPQSPTIDVASAADFLGISERTVRRLVAEKAIAHHRVVGLVRFTQADLDEFVADSRVPAKA